MFKQHSHFLQQCHSSLNFPYEQPIIQEPNRKASGVTQDTWSAVTICLIFNECFDKALYGISLSTPLWSHYDYQKRLNHTAVVSLQLYESHSADRSKREAVCLFMGEIRKTWPIYQRCGPGHEHTERGSVHQRGRGCWNGRPLSQRWFCGTERMLGKFTLHSFVKKVIQ